MKALLTAGGRATRLRPITHSINKHLIPLVDRPMLVHAIEKIKECGITEIGINVNSGEVEILEVLGDGSAWGVKLTYLEQKGGPQGLAHIIRNASDWLGNEPFLFYLGDNIILGSIKPLVDRFLREDLDCLLALAKVDDPQRFGVPVLNNGRITRVIEKPADPPSDYAVTGIYLYRPIIQEAVRDLQPSARGEYEISDAHTWLIHRGYQVGYEEVTGWWKDTGKPEDLIVGNGLLLDQIPHSEIAPDAVIEEGAVIEGNVLIKSGAIIGKGSRIIGPVSIGERCEIRESEIGPHVSLGKETRVHGMRIRESLIMDGCFLDRGPDMELSILGRRVQASPKSDTEEKRTSFLLGDKTVITWNNQ